MRKSCKQTLSLLLAVLLLCTAAPLAAGAEDGYKVGDLVAFGSYPQTEVKDAELVAALNAAGGTWQSYGYYSGTGSYSDGQMTAKDYMQYCDVTVGGQKYRGVTFSQYRPYYTGATSSEDNTNQAGNGYYTGVTYWFQYEPLYWRVLDPATGLVLCLTVIDSQPYNNFILSFGYDKYNNSAYWGDAGKTHFANNYAESSLRQWLNDDFYNTAFTAEQQNVIVATTLDNSAFRTDYSAYDSATTTDKVFLLSYSDMTNTAYGFNTDNWTDDPARQAESSDYAECQGVLVNSNKYSRWWLRSAGEVSCLARYVNFDGWVPDNCDVIFTYIGIRPALKLNLSSVTVEHTATFMVDGVCVQETKQEEGAAIVKPADPAKEGYTFTGWSPAVPATMPAQDMTFTAQFKKTAEDGYKVGDLVAFGSYPQTEVKDSATIAALNAAGGTWQSYGYYSGTGEWADGQMTAKDYMQYCDVTVGGQKYRGVTFSQYRPYYTGATSSEDYTNQAGNGYYTGVTYWFQYEPLYWRVLDPVTGLVLCETVIDSQPYNNFILYSGTDEYGYSAYWGDAGKTHYANNYAESSLRQWLNDDFYNTAFTAEQQNAIAATTLDNSAYDTSRSAYDSASTTDKVFLLSYSDMTNTAYGFDADQYAPARQVESSDYAKCQGEYTESNECSYWWLRSAGTLSGSACFVDYVHWTIDDIDLSFIGIGIRPALKLNLTPEIFESEALYLTLHCPAKIYCAEFEAYGVANPGEQVSLYDGETLLGTAQVSAAGKWSGSFSLQAPASPSVHTLTAKITRGSETVMQSKTLTYDLQSVYPVAFTLSHSGRTIDLLYVRKANLTVVPSNPMAFEVKLNTNDGVGTVEIVSVKGAETKTISAAYDSADGCWKASGWFDPANHSYVPGDLDVRINGELVKLETAKVHYLIDPSGYVYEAVRSNRVEGATASVYGKDADGETLWDANRYEQDNPQTTDAFGMYHWDVTEGTWRVKIEKDGYETAYSDWMDVPPEWTEVAIPLVTTRAPQVVSVEGDGTYTVTFSQYMDMSTVNAANVTVQNGGAAVPVTVTPVNAEASGTDSAVSYASVFRIEPQTAVKGKADIRIANVQNYAGIALEQAYTCTVGEDVPEYTATFMVDGVRVSETKYEEGAAIVKPADPTKDGCTFTGWSPAVPATMPPQDMTFTAQFQKNETPPAGKVQGVKANDLSLIYKKNGSLQPVVTADEGVKYTVAYIGFDSKIISIDANGKVTALKKGTTTVTVTATDENGNTEECTCKVAVKYAWWQVLIRIFLLGFLWY